jgi:hypothetical protein
MNTLRLVLFLLVAQLPLPPQPVRTGTASVEGIVVRLGTSEPISGVDLELTDTSPQQTPIPPAGATPATASAAATAQPPAQAPFTAKSGNDGRFVFRNLPSGAYKLVAARIGGSYVPFEYGQRGVLGRGVVFPVGDGDQKKDIRLEMAPVGSITGRVIDENTRPVGHAAVLALTPMYRDGQEVLNVAQIVHTNDQGEYRLFSLVPGKYYVAARPEDPTRRTAVLNVVPPGRRGPFEQAVTPVVTKKILPTGETVEETFRFVYYGGSTEVRRATSLTLTPGANLGAIDIPLAAGKTRALHIRGKVVDGSAGGPAKGANVRLIPKTFSAHMIVPQIPADANGEFDLVGVVPGSYELYVLGAQVQQRAATPGTPPPPPLPPLMNMMPIEIGNEDLNGLSISINVGSVVTGRITVEGSQQPGAQDLARIRVNLEPFPTGVAMVQAVGGPVTGEGTFRIENIWPAKYRVTAAGTPPNTYVKSIRMGSTELLGQTLAFPLQTNTPVEIVVGTDSAMVDGRVLNERGEGTSNVKVALVPDAPHRSRLDLYRNVATDPSGNFRLTNVPPGDYKAFAWEAVEDGAWTDPEFLRTDDGRGKAVRVTQGRSDSVSLTVIKR